MLGCLALFSTALLPSVSAQTYSTTLSGVTTWNGFGAPSTFTTEFPVGTSWTATLTWDTSAAALNSSATQGQFRLTAFELTLSGQSGDFTTSALANQGSFTINNDTNNNTYHSIQFTTAWGGANLTTGTIFGLNVDNLNISLGGIYTNGALSRSTPIGSLDLSNYDLTNTNASNLKIYYNNGAGSVQGSISAPALAPVPEPSTYALLAGCGVLAVVMLRRRR
ncbi:MAG: PEP-CTERM sorting domain-containing protein [Opitutaceae bacterium]|nr:PEP-CTERM sorting domain-containing protein [Opitutaceae bacterium]